MIASLDEIDRRLIEELEQDADRPNVELARRIGLSPAATLNRVRRLKDEGVIAGIRARVDPNSVGFPLQVFVTVALQRHDEAAERRFTHAVQRLPQVIAADWLTGETDVLLQVVARDAGELHAVLSVLGRAGASRVITHLRVRELKPRAPLPLRLAAAGAGNPPRSDI